MKLSLLFLTLIIVEITMAQNFDFEKSLYNNYEHFKEKSLTHRRFKHSDILPLINNLKNKKDFSVKKVGKSAEGRELNLIIIGHGKKKIFLWSQMHGDEPTATAAIFDVFNFFADSSYSDFKKYLLGEATIYFLPMVNPDGAEKFRRRNIFEIDINRDAARLETPEAVILKNVFDSLKADFGFNLHDQDHRYSVGRTFKFAALSFLAPAVNYEKTMTEGRERSVKLIGNIYEMLNNFIPGHIAKYSDDYEPRAFGDNFQKWGTSTILIESGGWKDDPEKQFLRKLNFITLLSSFKSIAEKSYENVSNEVYETIPFNDKYIFDIVLRNLILEKAGKKLKVDIGINMDEMDAGNGKSFYIKSEIADLGDLSVFFGYDDFDFSGYTIEPAKIFKKRLMKNNDLKKIDLYNLYKDGYSTVLIKEKQDKKYFPQPINLLLNDKEVADSTINIGETANFILRKSGKIKYIIVNGFIQKVEKNRKFEGNGLVTK